MVESTAALWMDKVFAAFDESVTIAIHNFFYSMDSFFNPFFRIISILGKWGLFLILLSFGLMLFKKTRKTGLVMIIALGIGSLFTNCVLKVLIARARPYTYENSIYYTLWISVGQLMESDKSFPSGHVTAAFASMTALFYTTNKKISWTAFLFAIAMCMSRIYFVLHYPSDVLGGIIVGVISASLSLLVVKLVPEKWLDYDLIKIRKY